jgi:hypothetical protein
MLYFSKEYVLSLLFFIACLQLFQTNTCLYTIYNKWIIVASYDMVHRYVRYNGHGLTILWAWSFSQRDLLLLFGLGSNGYLWRAQRVRMGHYYRFTSSVGHPRLDSVGLLVHDGMQQYQGHRYCTTGPSRKCQPEGK